MLNLISIKISIQKITDKSQLYSWGNLEPQLKSQPFPIFFNRKTRSKRREKYFIKGIVKYTVFSYFNGFNNDVSIF